MVNTGMHIVEARDGYGSTVVRNCFREHFASTPSAIIGTAFAVSGLEMTKIHSETIKLWLVFVSTLLSTCSRPKISSPWRTGVNIILLSVFGTHLTADGFKKDGTTSTVVFLLLCPICTYSTPSHFHIPFGHSITLFCRSISPRRSSFWPCVCLPSQLKI